MILSIAAAVTLAGGTYFLALVARHALSIAVPWAKAKWSNSVGRLSISPDDTHRIEALQSEVAELRSQLAVVASIVDRLMPAEQGGQR